MLPLLKRLWCFLPGKIVLYGWLPALFMISLLLGGCGTLSTENDRSVLEVKAGTWPVRTSLKTGSQATFTYTLHNRADYAVKLQNAEPLSFQGLKLNPLTEKAGTGQILQPGQDLEVSFNFTVTDYTLLRYPFALGVYYSYGGVNTETQRDNYELALKLAGYDLAKS